VATQTPTGIKVISGFLFFIAAVGVGLFILGIIGIILGRSLALFTIAAGVIATVLAVTMGVGLWHRKNWARILVLIFAVIQVAGQLLHVVWLTASNNPLAMVGGRVWLVIWAVTIAYLLQPNIKLAFANH
jgi:heme/copper-type cytochrome/quinol oxidase subunit 4